MNLTPLEDLSIDREELAARGRVLVVDDEYSIRYTFALFLDEAGYRATAVEDPEEALELLSSSPEGIDLAFVDILLENTSGIDLMRRIKERSPATEVVIVTGAPSVETASEALRLGAFDYLVKPVGQEALLKITDLALRHKAVHDAVERYRLNLEAIFRSIEDGVVTVDERLEIVEVNRAAERLCGVRRQDVLGRPISQEMFDCGAGCLRALRASVTRRPPVVIHNLECHSQKRPDQVVSIKATPLLRGNDVPSGGVLVIRDQTRLEALEQTLRRVQPGELVGGSPAMRRIRSTVESLAELPTTVLITGEAGVGKQVVAEALHASGRRRPLIRVSCAALPQELLESELFGHVEGAFVGAHGDRVGRFELARGGSLFLDQIDAMPLGTQERLLRVLETMEVCRLGDDRTVPVDVRVLAATDRNLADRVTAGLFREDLLRRLEVLEIHVPALRERPEDIPALVHHLLGMLGGRLGKRVTTVSDEVLERFLAHPWPGNVRQLETVLEHALVLASDEVIRMEDLPEELCRAASPVPGE